MPSLTVHRRIRWIAGCLLWAVACSLLGLTAGHTETLARFEAIEVGTTMPATCIPHKSLFILTPRNVQYMCAANGTSWTPGGVVVPITSAQATAITSCVPQTLYNVTDAGTATALRRCEDEGGGLEIIGGGGAPGPASQTVYSDGTASVGSTGLQLDSDSILAHKFKSTSISSDTDLGDTHGLVLATVGAGGITVTLPRVATTKSGVFDITIIDGGAGTLTLRARNNETMNSSGGAKTVTGFLSGFRVTLICTGTTCATNWKVDTLEPLAGELVTRACLQTNGATNTDSGAPGTFVAMGLSCTVPTKWLKANTLLRTCIVTTLTSEASSATTYGWQLKTNSTVLATNFAAATWSAGITNRSSAQCFLTAIVGSQGASVSTYTAPLIDAGRTDSGSGANETDQPVTAATNTDWVVTYETKLTDTTGTNTVKLQVLSVEVLN